MPAGVNLKANIIDRESAVTSTKSAPAESPEIMSQSKESPALLVQLGAEGIATVIGGCSKVLNSGVKPPTLPPGLPSTPIKGINYFGPHIINRWVTGLGSSSPLDRIETLVQLSSMPVAEPAMRLCRSHSPTAILGSGNTSPLLALPEPRSLNTAADCPPTKRCC